MNDAGDAEVEHLDEQRLVFVFGEKDVRWLQVAVKNPFGVSVREGTADSVARWSALRRAACHGCA